MKLSDIISVWEILHVKDVGEIRFCDLSDAIEEAVGLENDCFHTYSEIPKDAEIEEHPQRTEYEEIRQAYQRLVGRANPRYSVGDPSDAMIPRRGLWNLLRNFARGVARQVRKKYKRKVLTR